MSRQTGSPLIAGLFVIPLALALPPPQMELGNGRPSRLKVPAAAPPPHAQDDERGAA